ncbi:hypothetical protein AAMO2058_000019800 [Amorphochlora amoebiformis]
MPTVTLTRLIALTRVAATGQQDHDQAAAARAGFDPTKPVYDKEGCINLRDGREIQIKVKVARKYTHDQEVRHLKRCVEEKRAARRSILDNLIEAHERLEREEMEMWSGDGSFSEFYLRTSSVREQIAKMAFALLDARKHMTAFAAKSGMKMI